MTSWIVTWVRHSCAMLLAPELSLRRYIAHGDRYTLQAWCVIPNHVHVLLATTANAELGQVVHFWKTVTR